VAEYNQRLSDIRRRKQGVEQTILQRQQEQMQQYQQHMQQYQQQMQQVTQQELAQFVEKTGWRKPEEFQANTQRLRGYLINSGFQEHEVDSAVDHRALLVAEKARKYDELMSKVQTAKKKVGESPTMPSGRAARQLTGKRSQTKQAQGRLQKSGSLEDAASVINSLGIL
jgi:hypothetical protein